MRKRTSCLQLPLFQFLPISPPPLAHYPPFLQIQYPKTNPILPLPPPTFFPLPMWPPWARSPRRDTTVAATASPSSAFSISTIRGIRSLLITDEEETPDPNTSKKPSVFHRVRVASSALRALRSLPRSLPPAAEKRIVVYFTSLRVVRKTFEDCRAVRSILRGFRVSMDERDLSMDSCFLNELKAILCRKQLSLPRVFIGGRYMGGADEIRQLHEAGELKKYVEGLPPDTGVCDSCGDIRFVLCQICNGSHKFYTEKAGFRTCTTCNENGLVRCPDCCLYESV